MLQMPNWVVLGATGRNAGKTALGVWLIEQLRQRVPVCAVKVIQAHAHGQACPRGGQGCGLCESLQGLYDVQEETGHGDKDTMRFAAAGAQKVFLVRALPEGMAEAIQKVARQLPDDCVVICESNSVMQVLRPGRFYLIEGPDGAWKPSARKVRDLADEVLKGDQQCRKQVLDDLMEHLPLLRRRFPVQVTVEQARSLLLQHCPAPETQWVSVGQSYGRVLAETQCAPEPVPPFDRSPLDGYALRASDVQTASRAHPVTLCITEEVPAGHCAVGRVEPGTAIKILTGAPIPEGADVVVKFEDTAFTDETVTLFRPERSGSNLVRAGEDLAQGAVVAEAGTRLTPPVAGLLAAVGCARVPVFCRPRVALLSTGDELLEADAPLVKGKIRNSSLYAIEGYLQRLGAQTERGPIVPDDAQQIAQAVAHAAEGAELVVTTGGVSVGDYDMVLRAMERLDAEILFWKVQMKPGMACLAALWHGKLILSLSGNPAAAAVALFLLAFPWLRRAMGLQTVEPERFPVRLETDFPKASPTRRWIPGVLKLSPDGAWLCSAGPGGNGMLRPFFGADLLGEIPAGSGALAQGATIEAYRIFRADE